MTYFIKFFYFISLILCFFWWLNYASSSIFGWSDSEIPYCTWNDCWIEEWVNAIRDVDIIEQEKKASQYIQDIVVYVLWFLAIIGTLLIIYAWFTILISVWDEEKVKKSKKIIIYCILWLIIIYLAWPIIDFVFNILNS